MIKYKIHQVAKDLNVPSKDVIDAVAEYCKVTKKSMTALEESELNAVFEHFTQKNQVANFDEYFASNKAEETQSEDKKEAPQKEENSQKKDNDRQQKNRRRQESDKNNDNRNNKKQNNRNDFKKPFDQKKKNQQQTNNQPAQKSEAQPEPVVQTEGAIKSKRGSGRVIDTRAAVVDVERYNEKYDRLASEKIKTDNTVSKQKITQRSQQRGKKNSRKETEAERLKRIANERKSKPITVLIPDEIVVSELASRLKATVAEVVKKAFLMGTMVTANDTIDFDTASLIAMEFHAKVEKEVIVTIEERIIDDSEDDDENLVERAPVVVVMGHVDHGKTSLLDAIRHANVTASEAGGITQHIGAYRVKVQGRDITFLDTPGHEAFTTMRARGAQVTDIAILVVAADDGIMPQTVEAINHAKAAGVSVIVAINKMDKPGANPEQVKQQLTEYELVPEEWGGDTPCIPISAKTKQGLDELLEMVLLVADMKELKANPDRAAKGTVIEARLDKGRGTIATVLVQNGTLRVGDTIVAGTSVGRVRAMTNDKGEKVKEAGPSIPVEITGLDDVPSGGDIFNAVSDERLARELVEQRKTARKEEMFNSQTKVTLDNLFDQMKLGEVKELKIIVKADVQGSVEAVKQSLMKLSNDEVRVNVIHGGVGAINESDVMLANASNAIIVGFNVRPDPVANENAERDGVDMRLYRVIYDCIEEIEAAMKGMLAPKTREVILGTAECRNVIKVKNVGFIAGSYVKSGKVQRNAEVRVVRDGIIIADDKIASLQRFKDAVKEVSEGYECGIGLERFNDLKEGDIFEVYTIEEYRED
ncbi:MAG: translation initiation factor IF-2 [Anaeromassilibacillus sp.]|nr:translation initiation factor IF-2 [Anaeromassilibacillus sp.]MDY3778581.1 translation initiation factor IF-2 [Candidatus Limousia pullorum]